jgi:hypothetical protein
MARVIGLALATLMVVVGVIWTLQGLGTIGHSSASDKSFWAIAGPAAAGLGIALGIVVLTGGNRRR